jgi:hypothetical protein
MGSYVGNLLGLFDKDWLAYLIQENDFALRRILSC